METRPVGWFASVFGPDKVLSDNTCLVVVGDQAMLIGGQAKE